MSSLPLVFLEKEVTQIRRPESLLLEKPCFGPKETVYMNANTIAATKSRLYIILQSGSNYLRTINDGEDGSLVVLQFAQLTLVDNVGNLRLPYIFVAIRPTDILVMMRDGVNWLELSRSQNL